MILLAVKAVAVVVLAIWMVRSSSRLATFALGLGVRELSMNPLAVPMIKRVVRQSSLQAARDLVDRVMALSTPAEVEAEVVRTMADLFPGRTYVTEDEDTQF